MEFIQTIAEVGAIGIAGLLAWILWKIVGNHISHNTEAMRGLSDAITELTTYIRTINRK